MQFTAAILSAATLLFANQAMGAAVDTRAVDPRAALIATDAFSACNCPNNCDHSAGSSCKYHAGPSDSSKTVSGKCNKPNGNPYASLECIVTS
ncbi:hypothetical protein M426DRAFT_16636 [Hypoxylon sp. CI-4A]|nr:hypothetical protein M426DRAFT_16636 [Hypoxylon sp. CI-4A]